MKFITIRIHDSQRMKRNFLLLLSWTLFILNKIDETLLEWMQCLAGLDEWARSKRAEGSRMELSRKKGSKVKNVWNTYNIRNWDWEKNIILSYLWEYYVLYIIHAITIQYSTKWLSNSYLHWYWTHSQSFMLSTSSFICFIAFIDFYTPTLTSFRLHPVTYLSSDELSKAQYHPRSILLLTLIRISKKLCMF